MTTGPAALSLGRTGLEPLVSELARRMGASDRPVVSVQVDLDEGGRDALADLLGLERRPDRRPRVFTARLARALGTDQAGLRAAVEELAGPIGDRAATRREAKTSLDDAVDAARSTAAPLGPEVQAWAAACVRTLPGPVDKRIADVVAVLHIVTAQRPAPEPLAVVAATQFGNPHALDIDTRRGQLLGACCATRLGDVPPQGAEAWRSALASVSVVADELSSTVTVWRLTPQADHPLRGAMAAHAAVGEPAAWTLSMLRRWPIVAAPERVLVIENPAVVAVAAAERMSTTVVCSAGRPSVAVTLLLAQLAAAGARIDVHADLDEAGLSIVSGFQALGYHPWRMDGVDYLAVVDRSTAPITRAIPATPWDPALADAVAEHRRAVYEEQILDLLLAP